MNEPLRTHIILSCGAREMLQQAALAGIDDVNQVIRRLRTEYPSAFHSKDSLHERRLMCQPNLTIPYDRHLYESAPPWMQVPGASLTASTDDTEQREGNAS